jgi:chemotaxis protein methyltransferase CheR
VRDDLEAIRALIAEERFVEALERLGDDGDPVLRAIVLVHVGRLEAAEAACRALGDTALAHYLIATCREGVGDLAGAIDEARRATLLDPDFALAQLRLGLLARRRGERDVARSALGRAQALLALEDTARLALLGGGFGRRALEDLCRSELGAIA